MNPITFWTLQFLAGSVLESLSVLESQSVKAPLGNMALSGQTTPAATEAGRGP